MSAMPEISVQAKAKATARRKWLSLGEGLLYLLPSILLLALFTFYPMIRAFYLSLFNTDAQGNTLAFTGIENYTALFESGRFWNSMKVTAYFVLLTVPTSVILALFLALLANEKVKGIGFFRTIFSSTMGMSVGASTIIWMFMYNPSMGLFNRILNTFGLGDVQWLLDPNLALFSVSIATVWMHTGFSFLILLGGLQNIDDKLYESARIAGVGYWYSLRKITIPMLSPTLFFVITVQLINAFQTFGQIDILTGGGPIETTNVIVYSLYKDAFINYRFGPASAQAVILFFLVLIVTTIQFKIGERRVHYQ